MGDLQLDAAAAPPACQFALHQRIGVARCHADVPGRQVGFQVDVVRRLAAAADDAAVGVGEQALLVEARLEERQVADGEVGTAVLQGQIADGIETDTRLLGDAVARSRNAAGALEVAQAGNELTALSIKQALALQGLLAAQHRADTIAKALQEIQRTLPDVIVLDLTLGAEDGIDLIEKLRGKHADIRILVLSMHDELLYAERLLSMGVHGYIMKQEASTEFLRALRKVAAGDVYVSPTVNERLLEQISKARPRAVGSSGGLDKLTAREREVLALTGQGRTTREIAQSLSMSEKTVDSHRRNIRDKLGLHTSGELLRYAFRWVKEEPRADNR